MPLGVRVNHCGFDPDVIYSSATDGRCLTLALAYGFVLYAIVVLPVILAGILCLWKENLTLYRLARQVEDS